MFATNICISGFALNTGNVIIGWYVENESPQSCARASNVNSMFHILCEIFQNSLEREQIGDLRVCFYSPLEKYELTMERKAHVTVC